MKKHQRQKIPISMIQKTQKKTKTSAIPNFMLQLLPDDEIAKDINSLNSKLRKVFNVGHIWAKADVKCNGHNVEAVYILLSGSAKRNIQRHIKEIYNVI